MSTPRHRVAPGASYFVTTKCGQNRAIFQVTENAKILVQTLVRYRDQGIYLLHEFVVMPDHFHLILTPSQTTSLERAIGMIKGASSHHIHQERGHNMEIWQRGFHDWTIRDADDWLAKVEYIRMNPVRAMLAKIPQDWLYSSARGEFVLDSTPARYLQFSSEPEVTFSSHPTRGLKPSPPKEQNARTSVTQQRPRPARGSA